VEFVPEMMPPDQWDNHHERKFNGSLIIEYPRDEHDVLSVAAGESLAQSMTPSGRKADLQTIHLVAISRRPAVSVFLVPRAGVDPPPLPPKADVPAWGQPPVVVVEFGSLHVDSSVRRERCILLSNVTNVIARWRLLHVGRKRRPPHDIGVTCGEQEDFRALDDRDAFEFDVSEGQLMGPSKDLKVHGENRRMPIHFPKMPSMRAAHHDDGNHEPTKVTITFKPQRNELYKCRFRIQVEAGQSVDFVCRGCGSYDEDDDIMELQEA
jgi:hypothetical protein